MQINFECPSVGVGGIFWHELRANLSIYLGVNLASKHITLDTSSPMFLQAQELWQQLESSSDLGDKATEECPLGSLCLKMMGFMSLSEALMVNEVLSTTGFLIHEIQRFLAATLDWHLIARSGWPLMGFLSKMNFDLSRRLREVNPLNVYLDAMWTADLPYLDEVQEHLENWRAVPASSSTFVLSYHETSALTKATALLATADTLRPPRISHEDAGSMLRIVRRAAYLIQENLLKAEYPPLVPLSSRWPIFQLMDRLSCVTEVALELPSTAAVPRPRMALLPFREKVSDVVRACRAPYCDFSFMELVLRLVHPGKQLRLWEVGANLGDCTLWTAAQLGPRLTFATAVEPLALLTAALRRSVELNQWTDRISVVHALVGNRSGEGTVSLLQQAAGNPFAGASGAKPAQGVVKQVQVGLTSLSKLLTARKGRRASASSQREVQARPATLLKVWAYGDLLQVLASAPVDLGRRADAIWVAFAAGHFPQAKNAFLRLEQFFRRKKYVLSAPDLERDWCSPSKSKPFFHFKVRRWLRRSNSGSVLVLIAFRRGALHCPPWPRERALASRARRQRGTEQLPKTRAAVPWCYFGKSKRQMAAAHVGATYETYFTHLEQGLR